ncbi:MAG: sugar phosphate isomerase/epimerase [Clostridiales bacterium]|nr:sugar phosphate isomerase/epimerase [Clostridiales bacterium]
MKKFLISGFADEICDDFESQLKTVTSLGMEYICVRSVSIEGKRQSIADTTYEEAKKYLLPLLKQYGVKVSSIGSPIGKIFTGDDEAFCRQCAQLDTLCRIANLFGSRYMRIFSFYIPKDKKPKECRAEVLEKLAKYIEICDNYGIIPIHENEKDIYGDTGERCLDILRCFEGTFLRAAYDFANFVQCSDDPLKAYELTKPYIGYVHIKDADASTGKNVLCGTGDGHIPEILSDLFSSGYDGFLTMEPHLKVFASLASIELGDGSKQIDKDVFPSGEAAYEAQYNALKGILESI